MVVLHIVLCRPCCFYLACAVPWRIIVTYATTYLVHAQCVHCTNRQEATWVVGGRRPCCTATVPNSTNGRRSSCTQSTCTHSLTTRPFDMKTGPNIITLSEFPFFDAASSEEYPHTIRNRLVLDCPHHQALSCFLFLHRPCIQPLHQAYYVNHPPLNENQDAKPVSPVESRTEQTHTPFSLTPRGDCIYFPRFVTSKNSVSPFATTSTFIFTSGIFS